MYLEQANLFKVLVHPTRLAILDLLRDGEQCVCHLEAHLGLRQAYISQHLTVLRQAGLVEIRREGWNIYYKIMDDSILPVLDSSRAAKGRDLKIDWNAPTVCPCPKCSAKYQEIELSVKGVENVKN
jgi:ArsR family transcriptional regulator